MKNKIALDPNNSVVVEACSESGVDMMSFICAMRFTCSLSHRGRVREGEQTRLYQFSKLTPTSTSPGAARQLVTFLASPRKVTKRRRSPIRHLFEVPCVARLVRRLRNSHCVLRQSSPTTPDQPALLGGGQGEVEAKQVQWMVSNHVQISNMCEGIT